MPRPHHQLLLQLALAACVATPAAAAPTPPHVFFVLVDDLGWGNVGFNREPKVKDVITPNIDALVDEGVKLNRHYVHFFCTPTRTSVQSGRLPVHVSTSLRNPEDPACGVPRNMTGVAEKMKAGGYKTHMVGKWDAGMATPKHTPRGRGYDSSLIYFEHKNDFYTMDAMQTKCKGTKDLWEDDHPATKLAGSGYEEAIFEDRLTSIINAHDPSDPLFLFYTPHVAHCPLQAPPEYVARFAALTNATGGDETVCQAQTPYINPAGSSYSCRAQYHAMVNYLDNVLGNVTGLLKRRGMWENTLMVFSSDNGGPMELPESGANNWPLRGAKYSPFEGGIRVAAFASGGYLPPAVRGTTQHGMIHIADWYGTFARLAGVDPVDHDAAASGLPPVDSVDVWPLLSGRTTASPRTEIPVSPNIYVAGDYKIIKGKASSASWGGPHYPNATSQTSPIAAYNLPCGSTGCLFNVVADPHELHDLAASQPDVLAELAAKLDAAKAAFFENSERGVDACPDGVAGPCACWIAAQKYGGFLGPYQEIQTPEL